MQPNSHNLGFLLSIRAVIREVPFVREQHLHIILKQSMLLQLRLDDFVERGSNIHYTNSWWPGRNYRRGSILFLSNIFRRYIPFNTINNTNAPVTTTITVYAGIYDYPGPPGNFQCNASPQDIYSYHQSYSKSGGR